MEKIFTKKRTWLCVGIIAFILLCAAGWGALTAFARFGGGDNVRIFIPAHSSAEAVADTLRSSLGEKFGGKAALLWRMQGGKPDKAHGSYAIRQGMTALQVSRMLKGGHQTPVKVTFNNVRTMQDLAERVCKNLEITPAEFLHACDSMLLLRGVNSEQQPAMFVPDTHEFYWTASPGLVAKRLIDDRDKFWNVDRRSAASALGLTPEQVSTLASIVEEETAMSDERPKVARLYLNRLDKGMLLQADPTVKFAVGDFSLKRILSKHLQTESPYNTYIHPGLPPGPIRIASKAAIDAVLHPASHQYIYMCAKEDFSGRHNFTASFAEHQQNAARYRRALNARGIK